MNNRFPTEAHGEADFLLAELAKTTADLERRQAQAEFEIAQVTASWEIILKPLRERLKAQEEALLKLARSARGKLFDGADRVDLPHGALLHSIQEAVKKARGVLTKLEELGLEEAVKVVKTVKWDVLEKWPEEKLIMVGTERLRKEVFAYEVKRSDAGG